MNKSSSCIVGCGFQAYLDSGAILNFTCQQLIDYCLIYEPWMKIERRIALVADWFTFFSGLFGLISYILMIMPFFNNTNFRGASYIYHKSMTVMEIIHMVVMAQSGLVRQLHLPDTYAYVLYNSFFNGAWVLGDTMKLAVSTLTVFLSMERFAAIYFHTFFPRINHNRVAWSFVLFSLIVGTLHFNRPFTFTISPLAVNSNSSLLELYIARPKNPSSYGADYTAAVMIYSAKIISTIFLLIFCCGTALGLVIKSRRSSGMTKSRESRWTETARLCVVQIVIAMLQTLDHIAWVFENNMYRSSGGILLGVNAITKTDYRTALGMMAFRQTFQWSYAVMSFASPFDHAYRLPIYLVGMKTYRYAFCATYKIGGKNKTENSKKYSTSRSKSGMWTTTATTNV